MLPEWKKLEKKVQELLGDKVKIEHISGGHGVYFKVDFFDADVLLPLASEITIHISPRSDWHTHIWLNVSIWPKQESN
jgi:hypothetical protein